MGFRPPWVLMATADTTPTNSTRIGNQSGPIPAASMKSPTMAIATATQNHRATTFPSIPAGSHVLPPPSERVARRRVACTDALGAHERHDKTLRGRCRCPPPRHRHRRPGRSVHVANPRPSPGPPGVSPPANSASPAPTRARIVGPGPCRAVQAAHSAMDYYAVSMMAGTRPLSIAATRARWSCSVWSA